MTFDVTSNSPCVSQGIQGNLEGESKVTQGFFQAPLQMGTKMFYCPKVFSLGPGHSILCSVSLKVCSFKGVTEKHVRFGEGGGLSQ